MYGTNADGLLANVEPGPGRCPGYVEISLISTSTTDATHALHTHLLHSFGTWLNERDLRWQWEIEGRGWHTGLEQISRLTQTGEATPP